MSYHSPQFNVLKFKSKSLFFKAWKRRKACRTTRYSSVYFSSRQDDRSIKLGREGNLVVPLASVLFAGYEHVKINVGSLATNVSADIRSVATEQINSSMPC